MGFNNSSANISLTAKLTPAGRRRFATNSSNTLISGFSLGDSDANYYASIPLSSGQIPAESGDIGSNSTASNSTAQVAAIKSFLVVNANGIVIKPIETRNSNVVVNTTSIGQVIVSGINLTHNYINRLNYNTDSLVNLFYSFGLPVNSKDDVKFTGTTFNNGGYADTSLSGLAQNNIIVIGINNTQYGEMLDGKQIKVHFETSAATYEIYSTFMNKDTSKEVQDANYRDTSIEATKIDSNIAFLFSDSIQKPNNDSSLSWATGFGLRRPFSLNSKQLFNLQTDTNTSSIADKLVGIAYLDKGFIVITNPIITSAFTSSLTSATTITFDSVSTEIYQTVTCIADRGEFGSSSNSTFTSGDTPRISEVALYDNTGVLMAIAKSDRHITKNINEFLALGIKISL